MVILVAAMVLDVDETTVVGPDPPHDVARGRVRDACHRVAVDGAHVDVEMPLPRLQPGEVQTVGGELKVRLFRVTEEIFQRDHGAASWLYSQKMRTFSPSSAAMSTWSAASSAIRASSSSLLK